MQSLKFADHTNASSQASSQPDFRTMTDHSTAFRALGTTYKIWQWLKNKVSKKTKQKSYVSEYNEKSPCCHSFCFTCKSSKIEFEILYSSINHYQPCLRPFLGTAHSWATATCLYQGRLYLQARQAPTSSSCRETHMCWQFLFVI